MKKENWVWMPHAGHFIAGNHCRFRLNTYVGKYIVSTIGELWWDREIRASNAKRLYVTISGKGDEWDYNYLKQVGYDELGYNRLYETMVFKAIKVEEDFCCPYRITGSELDFNPYNTSEDAFKGHMALCKKWSKKK